MLRFDEIVFGPIKSRRLGSSLGVNLLPGSGKICNFDCIYCECGWNKDGRTNASMPSFEDVSAALEQKITTLSLSREKVDSITFSGNGEPSLHPDFPAIIDRTIELRDRYFPSAKISVLSNATMTHLESVRMALMKVDNPILKIDAGTDRGVRAVNKCNSDYSLTKIVENLSHFNGEFILQTMFLKSKTFDSADLGSLSSWFDIVRKLKPRQIMAYSLDRETPDKELRSYSKEEMRDILQPIINEGYHVDIY